MGGWGGCLLESSDNCPWTWDGAAPSVGGLGTAGPENHCSNESLSEYALKKDQGPGGL